MTVHYNGRLFEFIEHFEFTMKSKFEGGALGFMFKRRGAEMYYAQILCPLCPNAQEAPALMSNEHPTKDEVLDQMMHILYFHCSEHHL